MKTYYLQHHGILGQRWGKRNGPPYPLGSSDHSASEKKAGWRSSLNKIATATNRKTGSLDHDREIQKRNEERITGGRSKGSVETFNELQEKLRKKTGTIAGVRGNDDPTPEYLKKIRKSDGESDPTPEYLKQLSRSSSHEDYEKAHSKKSVNEMSDAELRSRLNRLNMEKQYDKLSDNDINRGKTFVSNSLKVATGIAAATSTALTIYNNFGKIKTIIDETMKTTS